MNISTRTLGGNQLVLEVKGAVDAATSQNLSQSITNLLSQGHHHIVIDASEINFISSAGIRTLLIAYKEAVQLGGDIKIVKPTEQVRRILDISGITQLVEVSEDYQE